MKSDITNFDRRRIIRNGTLLGIGSLLSSTSIAAFSAQGGEFEVSLSDEEGQKRLSPEQFLVLRKEATEKRYSSSLLNEKRKGKYHCAGCDLEVYSSETKYESGTGWPSFWEAISGAIGTKQDTSWFVTRTEIHCRRCGGHFGHIFDDGPKPTGKRHCLNRIALDFKPAL